MAMIESNLYGLVLTGGKSRRMGEDKALLSYHGKPQVEYVYELLSQFCEKVFLSKRSEQQSYNNLPAINDLEEFKDLGPLGGIASAMKTHPNASWLILACDLPFIDGNALSELLKNREANKFATAFISSHDNLPEPLCAVWEKNSFNQILEYLKQDIRCPRKVLIKSQTHLIEQKDPQWLENANTPEERRNIISKTIAS
jgi:molybdopterin-guanine dinucleotide biosynthesis protein A